MSTLADEFLADIANDEEQKMVEPLNEIIDEEASLKATRITDVTHLHNSERLNKILVEIEAYAGVPKTNFLGDADPEYDLIVSSNEMAANLQNEISVIHKFIRDIYSKKISRTRTTRPPPFRLRTRRLADRKQHLVRHYPGSF